jgi:hypothetical protein
MSMSHRTVNAEQTTISLGEIPLKIFKLPDGKYLVSKSAIAEAIGLATQYVSDFKKGKSLQASKVKDLTFQKIKLNGERITFDAVPVEFASQFWRYWDKKGNEKAGAIIDACVSESIERRADAAFDIQRTEEERQETMQKRIEGKMTRRSFTDAIFDYKLRHADELSDNDKNWMFSNASDQVDLAVFGRRAKKLATDLKAPKGRLRDSFTAEELQLVREVENTATRLIDFQDVHPIEAVRQAKERLLIPTQTRCLSDAE